MIVRDSLFQTEVLLNALSDMPASNTGTPYTACYQRRSCCFSKYPFVNPHIFRVIKKSLWNAITADWISVKAACIPETVMAALFEDMFPFGAFQRNTVVSRKPG